MIRTKRPIDYQSLTTAEKAWLVQVDNCAVCFQSLYEQLIPVAQRIASNYANKYAWLDREDIAQDMLDVETIRRIICGYRPGKDTTFEKYAYFRLTFEAKDVLRKEDPLGISWPQKGKGHYPEWHRLGDEAFSRFDVAGRSSLTDEERDFLNYVDSVNALRKFLNEPKPELNRKFFVSNLPASDAWTKENGFQTVRQIAKLTVRKWRKQMIAIRKQRIASQQLSLFSEFEDA